MRPAGPPRSLARRPGLTAIARPARAVSVEKTTQTGSNNEDSFFQISVVTEAQFEAIGYNDASGEVRAPA